MLIVETTVFTRQVRNVLTDEEYRLLQLLLSAQPDKGAVIKHSGGLRKIRWGRGSRGRSGGVRAIYYWAKKREQLLMLLVYSKSAQDDLTPGQLKILRRIVEEEYP
jgi:hypothetical protein